MDYPGKVITKNQVTPTQTSATGVWTLDDAAAATRNNNWPVAGVPNPISKSLRFNSADSAYLNRTPASATNRRTWTWSGWIKRGALSTNQTLFVGRSNGTNYDQIRWNSDDTLYFFGQNAGVDSYRRNTTPVYRDVSSWYHIVGVLDTTQATAANRVKLYINGIEVTAFSSSSNPTLNFDAYVNNTNVHFIGGNNLDGMYSDQYMTEINFIDGQALTPSSFGMTDPTTGVWEPLKYSGTYGTNGFYLNFKDATNTTTLGLDYSGNSNTWTTNNFSVTAGAGNDSLTDVPTPWIAFNTTGDVGGLVRGNYATLNPINKGAGVVLTNGSLDYTNNATYRAVVGTIAVSTGKYYWEVNVSTNSWDIGVCEAASKVIDQSTSPSLCLFGYSCFNGNKYIGASKTASSYDTSGGISGATVLGFAVDFTTGTATIYRDNVSKGVIHTWTPGVDYVPYIGYDTTPSGIASFNFGQRPFAYTPPSGFRSLCTTNLPASTVLKGGDYFNAVLYTGTSPSTNSVTGVGFQPDLVWVKSRTSGVRWPENYDVLRTNKKLSSNATDAEYTENMTFDSNGFTTSGGVGPNESGNSYVGWAWKANGAGVSNTAGSITSTVSANTTSGFSVVTYTGTGANATVGHGLGVKPSMIICKSRGVSDWAVYHTSTTAAGVLWLNLTNQYGAFASAWNSTEPSTSVFSVGTAAATNTASTGIVAYCFAAISGFSAFGSYTGNGSTDGPFVYLGFRPRFVMIKRTDSTANWEIWDTTRSVYNQTYNALYPNLSNAEDGGNAIDINSNGFKLRDTGGSTNATSSATYIYACFAENPFKNALAR